MSRLNEFEKSKKYHKKDKTVRKRILNILTIILIVLLILVICGAAFLYFTWKKGKDAIVSAPLEVNLKVEDAFEEIEEKPVIHNAGTLVEYKGKTYDINSNITTCVLAGIDTDELGNSDKYSAGQADVIIVAAYDLQKGDVKFIVIPRDTMVDMDIYSAKDSYTGVKENFEGIEKQAICLSFAYGDGKQISCEYLKSSVSRLLMGIPINSYAVIDLNGVGAMNDAVGGITLTSLETIDKFTEGETITLDNETALQYVRARRSDIVDADKYRRQRQKQFINEFTKVAVDKIKTDLSVVAKLYSVATTYGFTDYTLSRVTYLASTAIQNGVNLYDFTTIPGEYKQNGNFAEFYSDTQGLFELILDVFYNEV